MELEIINERGIFPSPYQPPSDQTPNLESTEPLAIVRSRVFEVPYDPSPQTGKIHVWALAMRPKGRYLTPYRGLESEDVIGLQVHYSADDITYDLLGSQVGWASRGQLDSSINASTTTVVVNMDTANLDLIRIVSMNNEEQADNTLLLFIDSELMSCGALSISTLEYTFTVTRGVFGTTAASHSANAEAFVAFREDLTAWNHERFLPDVTRYFKFQPYTRVNLFPLADITSASTGKVVQLFASQADAPVIALDGENPSLVPEGVQFRLQGSITFSYIFGYPEASFVVWSAGPTKVTHWGGGTFSSLVIGQGRRFDIPVILAEEGAHTFFFAAFDHRQIIPANGVTRISTVLTAGPAPPDPLDPLDTGAVLDKDLPPAPQNVAGFRLPAEAGYLVQFDWPKAPDVDYCWIYWTDQPGDTFADIVHEMNNRLFGTRDEDGARLVDGNLVVDNFIPWSLNRIDENVTNYFFVVGVDFYGNLGFASARITIPASAGRKPPVAYAKILPVEAPISVIDINADNTKTPTSVSMIIETVKYIPSPTYQWEELEEGEAWANISGETSKTLSRTADQVEDLGARGLYRCHVVDSLDSTISVTSNVCQIDINRHDHIGDPTESGDFIKVVGGNVEEEIGSGNTKWMVKDGKASFGDHVRLFSQANLGRIFAGVDPDAANPLGDDYVNMFADPSQAGITVGDGAGRTSYIGSATSGCVVRHTGFDWYFRTASGADRAFFDESTGILKYSDAEIEGYNGPTKVWGIDEDGNATFANMGSGSGDGTFDEVSVGDHVRLFSQANLGRIFAGADPDAVNPLGDDYANMFADPGRAGITVGDGAGRTSYIGSETGGCVVRHTGFDWYLRTSSRSDRAFFDESQSVLQFTDLDIQAYNGVTKFWDLDEGLGGSVGEKTACG